MITQNYIRNLLSNRKTILANLEKQSQDLLPVDPESEIIEGIVLGAQSFGDHPCVQKEYNLDRIVEILSRINQERKRQILDLSTIRLRLESKKYEILLLDSLVYSLPPVWQAVIISRFYESEPMTIEEVRLHLKTKYSLYYSDQSIFRITNSAIQKIAAEFNKKGLNEIKVESS
jgi:hypothetical protein